MRQFLKILCVGGILAVFAVMLSSCSKSIEVIKNVESEYAFVYPASATPEEHDAYVDFITRLRIKAFSFVDVYEDSHPADGRKEILVGNTNRPESAEVYDKLEAEQIGYYVINDNIVINFNFEGGIKAAADDFIERYVDVENYSLVVPKDLSVRIQAVEGYEYVEVSNLRGITAADPYVIHHTDGSYYYIYGAGDGFCINKIDNLDNIVMDGGVKVYTAPQGTMYSLEYWAPELHYINGEWYVYVAADDGYIAMGTWPNLRMHVFKGTSQDPLQPFEYVGQITDPTNKWAIDGAPFEYNGELYFVWSGWEGDENVRQNIYIAHMSNPWTIDSERVMISTPEKDYELYGQVNEGPAILIKDGAVIVVYSGSGCWTNHYCLASVTCTDGNLMNPDSWVKSEESLLGPSKLEYGPGHCYFTTADDGSLWVMYHANLEPNLGVKGRSVRIQPVVWDGITPTFEQSPKTVRLPKAILVAGPIVEE